MNPQKKETANMPENDPPIIDIPGTARNLGVTVEFYKKILCKFAASRDEYLLPLVQYAEEENYAALASFAHKLKGAAAYLNIEELKNLAFEIEILARNSEKADYPWIIDAIDAIYMKIAAMKEMQE